jgi:transcription elongation factor/antiterminator RfaH
MTGNSREGASWYVLHTRSRFEQVVFTGLEGKSLETFLPKITVMSRRKDRRKTLRVPLFPGYVFVKSDLDAHERLEIVKTVGVVRIVGNRQGPVPVPDEAIDSLRIMIAAGDDIQTGSRFKKGDRVIVVEGPLTGVKGTFVRHKGGSGRVVVAIDAMEQFASVQVHEDDLEKIPDFA